MFRFLMRRVRGNLPRFSLHSHLMTLLILVLLLPVARVHAKDLDAFQPWLEEDGDDGDDGDLRIHSELTSVSHDHIRSCIEDKASLLYFKKFILLLFSRKDLHVSETTHPASVIKMNEISDERDGDFGFPQSFLIGLWNVDFLHNSTLMCWFSSLIRISVNMSGP